MRTNLRLSDRYKSHYEGEPLSGTFRGINEESPIFWLLFDIEVSQYIHKNDMAVANNYFSLNIDSETSQEYFGKTTYLTKSFNSDRVKSLGSLLCDS